MSPSEAGASRRLDQWLFFARLVKSRTLAAKLVEAGHVRVNAARVENGARLVAAGDVLTIALEREVKVVKVLALGARRGPFVEARGLYEDLAGVQARKAGCVA